MRSFQLVLALPALAAWIALVPGSAVANDLAETREIVWSNPDEPDLLNLATELGTAAAIYEYVRNGFSYSLYDGARSNSTNTFLSKRGNDVDIASVLIAMLRSQGIPARYAFGYALIDSAAVSNWLELQDGVRSSNALLNGGLEYVSTIGGDDIEFSHVWVQALVPLESYRAAGPAVQIDCAAESAKCAWVDLDASFKLHTYRDPSELVDISDIVLFDYDAFYNADDPSYAPADGINRSEKGVLEIYEEQILQYLQTTPGLEGKTLDDVVYRGEIIREEHGVLPTSLPHDVIPEFVKTYSSVDDHDSEATGVPWKKTVSFTVTFPRIPELSALQLSGGEPVPLSDLATQNLTLSWESTDYDDPAVPKQLVTRRGGEIHEVLFTLTGSSYTSNGGNGTMTGTPPGVGSLFDISLTMSSNWTTTNDAFYPDLSLGGYFLIATGGETSNWSQVHRSARKLLESVEANPTLDDGNGVLYVDANQNGTIDPAEVPLLEDSQTQALLTGGVLAIAKDLYYTRVLEDQRRLSQYHRVTMPAWGFLGVVSSVHDVTALDGTAFSIIPAGLLVDMKGMDVQYPYTIDEPATAHPGSFRLAGHILSALEHEIWQELTGFEAISTMKGIQRTRADGAPLMLLDESQTLPVSTALTNWGFGQSVPSGFTSIDLNLFGLRLWLPRRTAAGAEETIDVIRETVTASTTTLRKKAWPLSVDNQGSVFEDFFQSVADERDFLQGLLDQGFVNFQDPYQYCVAGSNTASISLQLVSLQSCLFFWIDEPGSESYRDYVDFFDKNNGFVIGAHLYRAFDLDIDKHIGSLSLAPIRDDIVLGVGGGDTVEYVIPTEVARGDLLDFAVWIRRVFNSNGEEYSGQYIINRAAGGYVTGFEPLSYYDPFDFSFSNELYTDFSLTSTTNNSIFTPTTWDPISTVSGNVFHDEEDLRIKGRGLGYLFTRTYNSGPTQADTSGVPMGHKWAHSYSVRLIAKDYGKEPNNSTIPENSDGLVSSITYVEERGGESIFGLSGDPGPISSWTIDNPRGTFDTLDLSQGGSQLYTLRFRNGTEYVFGGANLANVDAVAHLLFIRDPYGNELSFGYTSGNLTSIQDNLALAGRTGLALSYFGNGRLQQIADWTGRTWTYTYDADGNLASAEDPLGNVTTYSYGADPSLNLLSEVAKPADRDMDGFPDVVTTFDYYANGRGFSNENSFGNGEQVDYDLFRRRTRVTNPRGFVSAHFYDSNGELTKLTQADGGISTFLHNPDGRRYSRTDALGETTQYSYCTARTLDGCATDTAGKQTLEVDALGNSTEYDYDPVLFDQVTRVKDKNDHEYLINYYAADNPATGAKRGKVHQVRLAQLGAQSNVLLQDFTYNSDGNLSAQVEYIEAGNAARTRTTTYSYSDNGLNLAQALTTGSDGAIQKTTFGYDGIGRLVNSSLERRTSPTDPTPTQLTTTYDYDAADRAIRVTDPMGNQTETDYDANGNVIETRYIGLDPLTGAIQAPRSVEGIRYDEADRVVEIEDVVGNVTAFGYDPGGNQTSVTDATGVVRFLDYDSRNRVTAIRDENGHVATRRYDQSSRLVSATDPIGNTTTHEYDLLGRRTATRDALGNLTTFTYDARGNATGQTNANAEADPGNSFLVNSFGQSLTRVYDQLGRVVQVTDAMDAVTQFEYDLLGNRTRVTDAKGQVTEFVYDDLGRIVEVIDPVIETPDKRATYQYDEAGNVIVATDREGNVVRTTYDILNRAVSWHHLSSGDIETANYDAFGNLAALAGVDVTYSFGYDTRNLLVSRIDSRLGRSLLFEYDAAGRPIKKTDYQGEDTYFQYDGTGRLVAERNAAYLQVSYHYDPAGRLLNRILSNGAQTDYTYDEGNRLLSLTNKAADGSTVHTRIYTRDAVGNITATAGTDGTIGYSYDALHRMLSADLPGTGQDQSFSYDAVGNRLTKTTAGETLNYSYGPGNRLDEIRLASNNALVNSFTYDDNGAMLEKRDANASATWSFTRDDRSRVVGMNGSGLANGAGSLQYDMQGARVRQDDSSGTRLFHLEGEHLEAVYDSAGAVREKYLRGVVVDEIVNGYRFDSAGKPENFTFHHDQLNSVVALSGHSGTTEESTLFSPFGETLNTSGNANNAMRYTGRRQVEGADGLYYYRARYYDPEIGRFLSEDPLGFEAGVNFYAYVGNNPVNANDPSGLDFDYYGVQGSAGAGAGGSLQLAVALDPEGNWWNPSDYYVLTTEAVGGHGGIDFSFQAVGGYSTADRPIDVRGLSGMVGGSGGVGIVGGVDVVLGQTPSGVDYQSYEGSLGFGGGLAPVNLHGYAATTQVETIPQFIDNLFGTNFSGDSGYIVDTGSPASGGFVLYPSKPNTNSAYRPYVK